MTIDTASQKQAEKLLPCWWLCQGNYHMGDGCQAASRALVAKALSDLRAEITTDRETVKELAGHVRALMRDGVFQRVPHRPDEITSYDAAQAALVKLDQTVAGEGGTE